MAGLIGSLTASLVLALCLFPPFGSLAIQEPAARIVMTLCQLCAIAVVVCYPPDPVSTRALRNPSSRVDSISSLFQFLKLKKSK